MLQVGYVLGQGPIPKIYWVAMFVTSLKTRQKVRECVSRSQTSLGLYSPTTEALGQGPAHGRSSEGHCIAADEGTAGHTSRAFTAHGAIHGATKASPGIVSTTAISSLLLCGNFLRHAARAAISRYLHTISLL